MTREPKKDDYITTEELLEIEQLCCFLKAAFYAICPDDFGIYDKNCEKLGRICYEADIGEFVFVPASLEQEA